MNDKKICKINDPRLSGYINRTRSGLQQVFYTGTDSRDWDRYKKDGGGSKPNVKMHDKPDTITIQPPQRSYYAQLIDGEWWWLNSCAECNGRDRNSWGSYIECEKHNVCRACGVSNADLPEDVTRWGGMSGWTCDPCQKMEHEEEKAQALADMPEEFNEYDYMGLVNIKCPYCNKEFSDSCDSLSADDELHECPRCDNDFLVTANHSVTFTCERK